MSSKYLAKLKFTAGIMLMVINTGIWINGLFIDREREMDIIGALPFYMQYPFLFLAGLSLQVKEKQQNHKG